MKAEGSLKVETFMSDFERWKLSNGTAVEYEIDRVKGSEDEGL